MSPLPFRRAFACLALAAPAVFAAALPAQTGRLLVLSKGNHTLDIVDPATLQVTGSAPVGEDPHEVIASADGRTAYVSNYGGGTLHTLAVVDLTTAKPRPLIDLGALAGPHGLDFVDGKVWFTVEGSKAVGRFDPKTAKVDLILGTGQNRTHMIHVAPGGEHLVVTNVASGTVSLLDREVVRAPAPPPGPNGPGGPPPGMRADRKDWNETVVRVGSGSEGFDLSPDGREIWVANAGDGSLSIIDTATRRVKSTVQINLRGANRLKFTLDGSRVLVSTLSGGGVAVLDAHTHALVQRVTVGRGAAGILMEPGGARAFVACTPDNSVAVLDLATLKVVGRIDAGPEPDGMAWANLP